MADVLVDGVRFHVVRLGPGADDPGGSARLAVPPVVFIHGLIMDNLSSFYYTLAPTIARKRDVVLFDLRGHGLSERTADGYRVEDGVADLIGILDALGIDGPVHLVGNSYGGTIALAAALSHPRRVAGLVLIEGHPAFSGWGAEMGDDLADLVGGFSRPHMHEYLTSKAPRYLRRMAKTAEDLVTVSSMREDLRSSRPTDPEDLAAISCPTLLLYGENSDIIDRAYVLNEAIPQSELRIIDGCSHALLMETPAEMCRQVDEWLDEQAPGNGNAGAAEPAEARSR